MKRNSSCRVSRKKTRANSVLLNALDEGIRDYHRMKAIEHVASMIGKGARWLFGKEKDIDTKKSLEIVRHMQIKLLEKGVDKKAPVMQKIKDFYKIIDKIEFMNKKKQYAIKEYQTEEAKALYAKIVKKYNKIMGL